MRDSDLIVRKDGGDCDSAVSHLGSDEFTLLASEIGDPADLAKIAQRVRQSLAEPFDLQGHAVVLQASIGIAAWPIDGDDVETLLRNADTAMHHAKRQGRNNIQFYTESMNAAALHQLTLEEKLRRALDENQFEVHYQPKVALDSGDIIGFEALLRWRDPEIGMVMPNDFIPIAEESGLIVKIGAWVVDEVCRQLAEWRDNGQTVLPVAINLSVQQLREADLATTIRTSLHSAGVEPSLLELEITESMLLGDGRKVRATLNALRVTGIQIAIDDFGTGYSSLSYLRHLPVDILKIDRSFVQNIEADEEDAALAEAIIAMARALRLKVVAEGVETPGQREILANWGCDEYQGFVFSPAVPASEVHGLFPVRSAVSDS
ncbi:MAG: bifunctional diguanylate cyclase/phosphodiesterase [Myxococcales bacterium]|nr:bifunctional diguanylate cyclase/phosphodiesterase [Myxococcales bacterium]